MHKSSNATPPLARLTASPKDVCAMLGLGLTKVYELMNDGQLESVKVGSRRLIKLSSVQRLVENEAEAA